MSNQKIIQSRRLKVINEPQALSENRQKWHTKLKMWFACSEIFCEMYREGEILIKNDWTDNQFQTQNQFLNTRKKFSSEVNFEIDSLDTSEAIKIIGEVCSSLEEKGYHYALFFAEGQRSPHIRIYDFEDLSELKPFVREEAEKMFWISITPKYWNLCDKSIWSADHPLQLEFALHWKYATPFDLIYEHLPTKSRSITQCKLLTSA